MASLGLEGRYLQLMPGKYRGSITALDIPGMQLIKETQNQAILKQVMLPNDICTVSFTWGGDGNARNDSRRIAHDTIVYLSGGTEIDFQSSAGLGSMIFVFDKKEFHSAAMSLDEAYWSIRSSDSRMFNSSDVGALYLMAEKILARSTLPPSDLQSTCLSHLLTALGVAQDAMIDYREEVAYRRAYSIVQRAREFIECPAIESITVLDVCRNIGVSRRTLQNSFEKILQISPISYMRMIRLNRARALLSGATPVAGLVGNVAAQCGFWHLSKFAQDYRNMFGERPSETLRLNNGRKDNTVISFISLANGCKRAANLDGRLSPSG